MSINFLSDDELEDMTGYKRSTDQAKVLDEHGIFYVKRPSDGKLRVTPEHVYNPYHPRVAVHSSDTPDFTSIGK